MSKHPLVSPRDLGIFFFFSIVAFFVQSCSSPASTNLSRLEPVIEMSKGPCYGRCPVFTLAIYSNGLASYKGERYTDRRGTYVKKLEKSQMDRILSEFKRANVWQFRDSYQGRIPDMQSVTIVYYEGGKKKSIMGKEIRPNAVKWLETQLDQIAQSEGWILKEAPKEEVPDFLVPDQLLVQLDEAAEPNEWAEKFAPAAMIFLRPVNEESAYGIFAFDAKLVKSDEMLEQVRMDAEVVSAEFNKKIYEVKADEIEAIKEAREKEAQEEKPAVQEKKSVVPADQGGK